jgi:choline/carnitine/betaine transport
MSAPPPQEKLEIATAHGGFYKGLNEFVAIGSKLSISVLVIWAAVYPDWAGQFLNGINGWSFEYFGAWYIYVMAFYLVVCLLLAAIPQTGRIRLGRPGEEPEFSRFSWFSMMFGAGIGIGMLTFSTVEPIAHLGNNPDIITGEVAAHSREALSSVFRWSFLHWGLSAWGCYALVGLSLAYYTYSRGLPLTIRSGLTPLMGKKLEGVLGHMVDISAVIATCLGVAVTIGFGISQFASGLHMVSGADWMIGADASPSTAAMIVALLIIMTASVLSAASGVRKGIKWLSIINMVLSFALLGFFLLFGAGGAAIESFLRGALDYLVKLPLLALTYWPGTGPDPAAALYRWQSVNWTVFYWAWWIAFAPFVGLFLARISKGRTVREFVLGVIIIPALMCFAWFTIVGGTAIELELSGQAGGAILSAQPEAQLFATLDVILSSGLARIGAAIVVVLLLTYLVTSADSAVLIINTINSGGNKDNRASSHIVIWGLILTGLIGALLMAGGMGAVKSAMLIGALPFSFILALLGVALLKAVISDGFRARAGP